jgi:tRNA threonylcarbamoyl adenosine modification protein YjeE
MNLDSVIRFELADEAATIRFAEDLAVKLRVGDVIALKGDLGAGKTTLARALIRAMANDPELEVPSPTFTIVQTYAARLPIAHFDLYRLGSMDELEEIGFDEAIGESVVLVEWPERAGGNLPPETLEIALDLYEQGRVAELSGGGDWPKRLRRTEAVRNFLDNAGWEAVERRHLQGDASSRTYERVCAPGGPTAILMDAPEQNPGWVVRDGKSYDDIAHRATSILPFVAIGEALRAAGLSAPAILAADLPAGMLLLEDLGTDGVVDGAEPIFERYAVAVEALAHLHSVPRPDHLPLPDGGAHIIPPFDRDAVTIEVELLLRWYAPLIGRELSPAAEDAFVQVWADLFAVFDHTEKSWLLRDFHSPNLIWLPKREGVRRVGVLDYQDAMIGPSAYDVASLGQDVRVTIEPGFESALKAHYVAARRSQGAFDAIGFANAYAISGAQRNTKILGGFARLASSAGKPQYLRHIPRIKGYLKRCLDHPVLSELRLWYERYLPLDD